MRARLLLTVPLLSLLLALPAGAVSRRKECRERCADAVVLCASTCGSYGDMVRSCRRALVHRCLREGASVCTALATPTTTLVAPPPTTSTTEATTTTVTTTSTTTTTVTLPLPVRERSATIDIAVLATQSRLTVDVENGPQLDVTVELISGDRLVCLSQFHVVQGSAQFGFSPTRPGQFACLASEPVCDRYNQGVVVRFSCTDFPAWFDPSASFLVDWSGTDLALE